MAPHMPAETLPDQVRHQRRTLAQPVAPSQAVSIAPVLVLAAPAPTVVVAVVRAVRLLVRPRLRWQKA